MRLRELLGRLSEPIDASALPDVAVRRVQEDSRRVRPGDVFVARKGEGADGKEFVGAAVEAGAVAIVSDAPIVEGVLRASVARGLGAGGGAVPVVVVKDAAAAVSVLANAAMGDPSRQIKVVGVTGTNGKTTVTFILRHLLRKAGITCGLIGTCEVDDGRATTPAEMTTPGAAALAEVLATMRDNGCGAVAMETSSHALAQGRVAGVRYAAAGFTNLTGDHLDYHKTMNEYAAAKAALFAGLDASAVAAVNGLDSFADRILRDCPARPIRFSTDGPRCHDGRPADYYANDVDVRADGSRFMLHTPHGQAAVHMRLVGRHNIQNALCAASIACEAFGLSVQQVADGLADAEGAPGRLQRVDAGQAFTVLVDYAHTDDALANVLSALRPITLGKLRVVFGCGGDRDRTKRPRMAKVAERFADAVYVTSDNPRTEEPSAILEEIVAGFDATRPALVEVDRGVAIRRAISEAGVRDVVLIAGKGHENYQILGKTKHPFDDVEEARTAIAERQTA